MKLALSSREFQKIIEATSVGEQAQEHVVHEVVYDTRKITRTAGVVFFALHGPKQNGHIFIQKAYDLGIRHFVVEALPEKTNTDATYYVVSDTLAAIQKLAIYRRSQFQFPVVVIAGSIGKTTVKEWIHHLLAGQLHVVRSPKSYNSQLGVALSILELPLEADLALIEAAATKPGELLKLQAMIQPNYGIITNYHLRGNEFNDLNQFRTELQYLVHTCDWVLTGEDLQASQDKTLLDLNHWIPFKDPSSVQNAQIALAAALKFAPISAKNITSLPRLALRLETFEGIQNAVLIQDAYTLDILAFEGSLAYLKTLASGKKTMVCCYLKPEQLVQKPAIEALIQAFEIDSYFLWEEIPSKLPDIENQVVLLKGNDLVATQKLLEHWCLKKHSTSVTYDLAALKHNLNQYRQILKPETNILVMVKAQAYGAGHGQWVSQLLRSGANYLGVAYADEGQELRAQGIQAPILVMNAEPEAFDACINAQLEPAIYSLEHLDIFLRKLISRGLESYPIHIKLDTGMHRLGFQAHDVPVLIEMLLAQPEVQVKSIYSHMACADDPKHPINQNQIQLFEVLSQQIMTVLPYPVLRHLLNSEGASHFPEAQYDMVRIGIGLFGINHDPQFAKQLRPVLSWRSSISQIKSLEAGACVGYGCTERTNAKQTIAIIPVGYADGFKRNLGEGKGGVYINGNFCQTIGRVCMDMIMVRVSPEVRLTDEVEIIGTHQTLTSFAMSAHTIPYEILTSISPRVQRVYAND
jgi:alanine racemase